MQRIAITVALAAASHSPLSASDQKPFHKGETGGRVGTCEWAFEGKIEDVKYEYSLGCDGSGTAILDGPRTSPGIALVDPDRWVVEGKVDSLDDTVTWTAIHYKAHLSLGLTRAGNIDSICVIYADFPNRPIAVRVGTNAAIRLNSNCSSSSGATLKRQLMEGGFFFVRGYEWPYDYYRDESGRADNFALLMKLYAHIRSSLPNYAR